MKAIYSILLAALLAVSVIPVTMQKAIALDDITYGATAIVEIDAKDKNGNHVISRDFENFVNYDILQQGKTTPLDTITFRYYVEFVNAADNKDIKITSVVINPELRILTRSGEYIEIPLSESNANKQIVKTTVSGEPATRPTYRVFERTIQASALESIIGTGPSVYYGDIRTNLDGSFGVTATVDGFAQTLVVDDSTLYRSFRLCVSGTNTAVLCSDKVDTSKSPSGHLYTFIKITNMNGQSYTAVANNPLKTFDLVAPSVSAESINYVEFYYMLQLDQDTFGIESLKFPEGTDNYAVAVNGENVYKDAVTTVAKLGGSSSGNYQLLYMKVPHNYIEDALNHITGTPKQGKIEFNVKPATMTLTAPGKSYDVSLPKVNMSFDLESKTVTGGDCTLSEGQVACDTGFDFNNPLLLGVVAAVALIGGVILLAKKKHK